MGCPRLCVANTRPRREINSLQSRGMAPPGCAKIDDYPVIAVLLSLIAAVRVFFLTRTDLAIEVLALRHQVAVLKRKRPRPPLSPLDRLFWTVVRNTWSRWRDALVIVQPETVVGWHRASFRLYWRWKSRKRGGRPKITPELRSLIRRLAQENTDWGAPKIHGELQKLGFVLSERTVARYLSQIQRRGDAAKKWSAFLHNHRDAIAAFDFFTVPTATFRILYCFFVIEHERCRILHFNITRHPSADWVVQQLREAFPEATPYRYAILDHDSIFNDDVIAFLEATGLNAKRTSIRAPWQNGTAERWIGSCRREILDHVIPVNEEHLRRVVREYICYHHEDRVHDSLSKDTPTGRPIEPRPVADAGLNALPRLGGLHHRYTWRQAA
jgi:putative transposase